MLRNKKQNNNQVPRRRWKGMNKFEVEFILRWGEYFNGIYARIEAAEVDRVEINGKIGN